MSPSSSSCSPVACGSRCSCEPGSCGDGGVSCSRFTAWDAYAIGAGHWDFDLDRILGVPVVAGVPIDEVLFFICIPLAAILTLEAVRSVKPWWRAGDES